MPPVALQSMRGWLTRGTLLRISLLVFTGILALAALILPIALRPTYLSLDIGAVAEQDVRAPQAITYNSVVLTDQTQRDASQAVAPVYLPVDVSIGRSAIERLQIALAYITSVRSDIYASQDQKLDDLSHLENIRLQPDAARRILQLGDGQWRSVQEEAVSVLGQVMRNTIRDDQIQQTVRSIPSLVSYSFPQDQSAIVNDLVSAFVIPNSIYSQELTEAARQNVVASIAPISRSYAAGETIVQRGQVITPAIHEALLKFDLIRPKDPEADYIASACLVAVLTSYVGLYFYRRQPAPINDLRSLILTAIVLLIFLWGARLIIPNRTVIPYIFPLPAFGLVIAVLFNIEVSFVLSMVLSILAAYGIQNSLELTIFYLISSLCGVLILGKAHRIANFFWSGIAVGIAGVGIIFSYRLAGSILDWVGLATLAGAAMFNGLASASLALLIQFLLSQVLGLTTALQLLEISRPDHPLLQFLLRNAPGTYQHSLQVANLAEQAAEAIGADGLLTRVGAIYHDAGKALDPIFFVENQPQGKINPHDDLDPAVSAAAIIRHVENGLILARKHHLPPRVRDFISEHHGTLLTKYQYTRAVEMAGGNPENIDIESFRYPGPRPQTRETALLMLADGCEARARSELPKDEQELRKIIQSVFDRCEKEGQLDDTRLTLRDLNRAAESFYNSLKGVYHRRIIYPEMPQIPGAVPVPTQPISAKDPEPPPEIAHKSPAQSTKTI